jgi:phage baseplate assembly protein W
MPTQTTRVDPRDLQPNVALGISLPFNGPSVFNSTYSTQNQAKYKLVNMLLTNKKERVFNLNFGVNIREKLFDQISLDDDSSDLKQTIVSEAALYIPEIIILDVTTSSDPDNNTVTITVSYQMKLSGNADSITINFE